MAKRIEVLIDEDGNCTIEAFGYTGGECTKATEELEKELGTPKGQRRMKPEARQSTQKRTVDRSA